VRTAAYWILSAAVLAVLGGLVYQKETILRDGQVVFLRQAPVDPRSLMQGDYMRLRYAIQREVRRDPGWRESSDGTLVLRLDERHVGHFVRIHGEEPLDEGEILLRYRRRRGELRLGAESYLFQEGHGGRYDRAAYSELRVAPSGESILVGLRDADLKPLGTEP
jgi:uncharacterized membrane-anchored protein